nr:MAG TPA: hypothetical protein [Caudoviricetes sp.]
MSIKDITAPCRVTGNIPELAIRLEQHVVQFFYCSN